MLNKTVFFEYWPFWPPFRDHIRNSIKVQSLLENSNFCHVRCILPKNISLRAVLDKSRVGTWSCCFTKVVIPELIYFSWSVFIAVHDVRMKCRDCYIWEFFFVIQRIYKSTERNMVFSSPKHCCNWCSVLPILMKCVNLNCLQTERFVKNFIPRTLSI